MPLHTGDRPRPGLYRVPSDIRCGRRERVPLSASSAPDSRYSSFLSPCPQVLLPLVFCGNVSGDDCEEILRPWAYMECQPNGLGFGLSWFTPSFENGLRELLRGGVQFNLAGYRTTFFAFGLWSGMGREVHSMPLYLADGLIVNSHLIIKVLVVVQEICLAPASLCFQNLLPSPVRAFRP